jgi:hypothetical protein
MAYLGVLAWLAVQGHISLPIQYRGSDPAARNLFDHTLTFYLLTRYGAFDSC